jgi:hypothetical protein
VPESPHNPDSAEQIVRAGLAAGDRRRRGREASRYLWRIAPALAVLGVCTAVAARWIGWSRLVPVGLLAAGFLALLVFAFVSRRTRPLSDAVATSIDGEAGMRGELRSANWFAAREGRDAWAEFHLLKAADRLQTIDWTELYPAIRARRAQAATLVLVVAAILLTFVMPEQIGIRPAASAESVPPKEPASDTVVGRILDPELQRMLEELLAAASAGTLPSAEAMAADDQMREMLKKLNLLSDAELLAALQRALAANPDLQAKAASQNMKALAEQAKRTFAEAGLPKDLQEALEKLSDEMELASGEESEAGDEANAAAGGPEQGQMGQSSNPGASEELSIQFAKSAEEGGGAGMMMMASQDSSQSGGPPGSGVGGAGGQDAAASDAILEAALKKEMVEASQDTAGENVETDIRRKTEHGDATVGFTGSAAGRFDRTRATAAPPVPEARRSGVQTYFVRKPQ